MRHFGVLVVWLAGSLMAQPPQSVQPAPAIAGFHPAAATAGGSTFILTVNGANFLSGAVVNWNGTGLATTFVSSTQVTAVVPATLFNTAGTASITVTNLDGETSGASSFPINGPLAIMPTSLPDGTVGVPYLATLTVTGGLAPYTWGLSTPPACPQICTAEGCLVCALPPGLKSIIGPTTVTITGVPTAPGPFTFGFHVTDSNLVYALQYYPIAIAPVASILCTPSVLSFTYTIGGTLPASETCVVGSAPAGLSVGVTAPGEAWLSAAVSPGVTTAMLTISVNPSGLAGGVYSGTVPVTVGGFPSSLPVTLTVNPFAACQFTLAIGGGFLTAAGTSTGGVLPEIPATVGITPAAGTGCSGSYSAASSATWLTATTSGNSFNYTALSNAHSAEQLATLTIANSGGGSQNFTVTEAGSTDSLESRQVRALYQTILGRDPDAAGFAFWTGAGAAGLGQMADSFLTSPEAFNGVFAVMAAYQAATGSPPSYAQYTAAVAGIRADTETVAQLFVSLIAPIANYSATTLYENVLGRAPTAAENTACASDLALCFETVIGYPASNTPVVETNLDSTNALYITTLYYTILGRAPDPAGFAFWQAVANAGGPGIWFQGPAGYPTRIQIVGPGTPGQGFLGGIEFWGLYQ
jgi:hypothetical protein